MIHKLTLALTLFVLLFSVSDVDAQIFRRSSGYQQTQNGYIYRGKTYVRGIDLPDNPNCPCPMCRDLVNAYNAARSYRSQQPVVGSSDNASTKLIGTPHSEIDKLLKPFNLDEDFTLLDPGCGDARILIHAAKQYGANCVGIEINPQTYKIALENVRKAGVQDKVKIINGDSRNFSFENVDGIVMFLFPDLISDLTSEFDSLKSGARVVSYSHDIPLKGTIQCDDFYVWTK